LSQYFESSEELAQKFRKRIKHLEEHETSINSKLDELLKNSVEHNEKLDNIK
jgi:predicted transcriptional regulator